LQAWEKQAISTKFWLETLFEEKGNLEDSCVGWNVALVWIYINTFCKRSI